MKPYDSARISVTLGDGVATVRREGVSSVTCATILGREHLPDGTEQIYLDRLVHRIGEDRFGEWHVRGAIATVLERAGGDAKNPVSLSDIST